MGNGGAQAASDIRLQPAGRGQCPAPLILTVWSGIQPVDARRCRPRHASRRWWRRARPGGDCGKDGQAVHSVRQAPCSHGRIPPELASPSWMAPSGSQNDG